jgi:hypothetical protein
MNTTKKDADWSENVKNDWTKAKKDDDKCNNCNIEPIALFCSKCPKEYCNACIEGGKFAEVETVINGIREGNKFRCPCGGTIRWYSVVYGGMSD